MDTNKGEDTHLVRGPIQLTDLLNVNGYLLIALNLGGSTVRGASSRCLLSL